MPASTADQRSYSRHLSATNMSNSSQQNAYLSVSASIPVSPPPPPTDLSSYSRTMHQHTKQMMEAVSRPSSHRRGSRNHSQGAAPQQNGVSAPIARPPTTVPPTSDWAPGIDAQLLAQQQQQHRHHHHHHHPPSNNIILAAISNRNNTPPPNIAMGIVARRQIDRHS